MGISHRPHADATRDRTSTSLSVKRVNVRLRILPIFGLSHNSWQDLIQRKDIFCPRALLAMETKTVGTAYVFLCSFFR